MKYKNLSKPLNQKRPGPDVFSEEFYWKYKEELITILLKLYQKINAEGSLPNYFYVATITLIHKPHKTQIKKGTRTLMQIYSKNICK